jgi:hypothetical protein
VKNVTCWTLSYAQGEQDGLSSGAYRPKLMDRALGSVLQITLRGIRVLGTHEMTTDNIDWACAIFLAQC